MEKRTLLQTLKHQLAMTPKSILLMGPRQTGKSTLLSKLGIELVGPLFIMPGSPWENGYCESFNGKMRYELLNGEIFYTILEARVVIEKWRQHYNTIRPHSALGGKPPAPLTAAPKVETLAG